MLSLSDATQVESLGDKAVSRFRPWWEVLTFYCLNGLLMAVLFALAGVTISGTYNIWCFPLGNDTALDFNTVNYANSRCSRIFEGSSLIYFPYGMFLEWAVLFAVHVLWFKLPATFFLFQQLSEVFSDFSSIKPVEYNTKKRKLKRISGLTSKLTGLQLKENKATKERIHQLVDRLMEVLQKDNHLLLLYALKAVFLTVASASVVIVLSTWLSRQGWHASFPCDMTLHIPVQYKDMTCSLPAAPFLYGLMICNIIFAFCISLSNLRAILWLVIFKKCTSSHYKEAFGKWDFMIKKPGFSDFCFCLSLTSLTSKDGMILGDIIYSSLKLYQKSDKHVNVETMKEINKPKFSAMFYQGEVIAHDVGLKVLESRVSEDSLFRAIASVVGMEKPTVCGAIAQELITNISVYKDLVDNDLNCPVFEECVELIQFERKSPKEFQHYVLMAACNAFYINIVVLRASCKCWYYKVADSDKNVPVPTKYLLFIQPNYYTATEEDLMSDEGKEEARNLLISDALYRKELHTKALAAWEANGLANYKTTMKALCPQVILYGRTSLPEIKQPTNILSDLFNEMGHKISKQIFCKIYIPGLRIPDQNTDVNNVT